MTFIYVLDLIGTFVFALSGLITAVQRRFDIVGSVLIAFVTAIGGGTTRDLLIGATPVGWMQDVNYVYVIAATIPICYFFYTTIVKWRKSFFIFDTIGIALFTILGVQKTLALGLHPIIAVMMGTVSACFGGVVRDVLTNEIPLIFQKEVYATACFAGAVVYLITSLFPLPNYVEMIPPIIVVITIRVLAVYFKWEIPFNPRKVFH